MVTNTALASKADAEAFLARALPMATAANPRYHSPDDPTETAWITRSIKFTPGQNSGAILVSMSEEVLEFRNGAQTTAGSHETEFSLGDVEIAERRDSGDLAANGDPALGVIFKCRSGNCIHSTTNGVGSLVGWTDIYIQDGAARSEILEAFKTLN